MNKINIQKDKGYETDYWLELLVKSAIIPAQKAESLRKETKKEQEKIKYEHQVFLFSFFIHPS